MTLDEYFNGVVQCVDSGASMWFRTGERYQVVNGYLYTGDPNIVEYPYTWTRYDSVESINKDNRVLGLAFIEV